MGKGELMFVNLVAPINPLGYGVVGYNVLKHLSEAGHSVSYWPIGQKPVWENDPRAIQIIKEAAESAAHYNSEAPSIRIWHQNQLDMFPGSGPRIGWPIFELDKFDERELHHLSNVDMLFVCSKWGKEVLERDVEINRDIPVHVIPLGVDLDVFYRDEVSRKNRPYWTLDSTIFINVGKWEKRKGHEELLAAFNIAFKPTDNVELWMVNENPFIGKGNQDWKRRYISSDMGKRIKILPRVNTQAELRGLFSQVDFGVFPSHAEGWNLEILELMACGVPSIATNYSGHTEFLDSTNALLIEPTGMEDAQDGIWFHGQGQWCSFDVDTLIEAMRIAHDLKQSNKIDEGFPGLNPTVSKYTWKNTIKEIEKVL